MPARSSLVVVLQAFNSSTREAEAGRSLRLAWFRMRVSSTTVRTTQTVLKHLLRVCVCVCVCGGACICHVVHVEVRGQFEGFGSQLTPF